MVVVVRWDDLSVVVGSTRASREEAGRFALGWSALESRPQERPVEQEAGMGRAAARFVESCRGWGCSSGLSPPGLATACSTMGMLGRAVAVLVGSLDQCGRAGWGWQLDMPVLTTGAEFEPEGRAAVHKSSSVSDGQIVSALSCTFSRGNMR